MAKRSRIPFDDNDTLTTATASRSRWLLPVLMFPLLGSAVAYMLSERPMATHSGPAPVVAEALKIVTVSTPKLIGDSIDFVVRRNDTAERIFRHLKLNLDDLATLLQIPRVREALNRLRPGDKVTVVHEDGAVQAIQRRLNETEVLSVTRHDAGFAAEVITTPIEIKTAQAQGVISTSLFAAARTAGVSPENILRLANDIFGWEIDFALDIRPGDRFHLVYEQKYRDGEHIGDGRILAAEFINDGERHRAVYYASADGNVEGYFSPDGRSMRRQFVRAPLDFTRVSSNFNPSRRHPILNTIRAHQGVDYAAATGTAIKAAGDGRVNFVGMKGGYGRVVILEHGGKISTLYAHMSGFARGLHAGDRVKQGQTIGYVGSSGAATGPHLHYEYRVNGAHMNPRTVKLPSAAPIPSAYAADFHTNTAALLAGLDGKATVASN